MGSVIGDLLPVALGVAISPMPVIAVILMLLSPRAGTASVALLAGWVVGIALVVTVVAVVIAPVDDSETGNPSTLSTVLKLVLGAAVVLIGVRQWGKRPKDGETASIPAWMGAIDQVTPLKAFGLGVLLSGVNPKNLTLGMAGGVIIATGGLTSTETAVAIAFFVVVGSLSMAVPVVGYLVARERMQEPLVRLRDWLTANNAPVMSVLLLVIGAAIFGKGLAGV